MIEIKGGRRFPAKLFAMCFGIVFAFLVMRQTYVGFLSDLPAASANLLPPPPAAPGALLLRNTLSRDGQLLIDDTALAEDRIAEGHWAAPLYPTPYMYAARKAADDGNLDRATQLLNFVKLRDPRNYAARRLLSEYYLRQQNVTAAVREIFSSALLYPEMQGQFMQAVRLLGNVDELRSPIIDAMRSNPHWAQIFYASLPPEQVDDDFVLALASKVAPDKAYQRKLIQSLINKGQYGPAFIIWKASLPSGSAEIQWPYDRDFAGKDASPPFNWSARNDAYSRTEFTSADGDPEQGAVRITYFASADRPAISQIMMLSEGRYSFEIPYTILQLDGTDAYLTWKISCAADKSELTRSTVDAQSGRSGKITLRFTVPDEGCAAQQISLSGKAAGKSRYLEAEFLGITVSRNTDQ